MYIIIYVILFESISDTQERWRATFFQFSSRIDSSNTKIIRQNQLLLEHIVFQSIVYLFFFLFSSKSNANQSLLNPCHCILLRFSKIYENFGERRFYGKALTISLRNNAISTLILPPTLFPIFNYSPSSNHFISSPFPLFAFTVIHSTSISKLGSPVGSFFFVIPRSPPYLFRLHFPDTAFRAHDLLRLHALPKRKGNRK